MDRFDSTKRPEGRNLTCADLATMAERELTALFEAVTELFGSQQAGVWAEDWLHELMAVNALPTSAAEWRLLTVKVVTRLAGRANANDETASELASAIPS